MKPHKALLDLSAGGQLDLTINKKKCTEDKRRSRETKKIILAKSFECEIKIYTYLFISSTYRWRIMKIIQFYPQRTNNDDAHRRRPQ